MSDRYCQHRVRIAYARSGRCERCDQDVVANGCGPGFILAFELNNDTGWRVCTDGLARWFGTEPKPDRGDDDA